jgi:anthranilate phosphoribosyltransferase
LEFGVTLISAIQRLLDGQCLSAEDAFAVASELMAGVVAPAQAGALLSLLRARRESADVILGFARAMRERMTPVDVGLESLIDTCGTGGDGRGTFNVSTVSALVAAGAGCRVAKHGNRRVSSRCGSADVLEALGVPIHLSAEEAGECLRSIGIAFLFAPDFHPALRNLESVRRQLGFRTIFNLVGPLANPARVRRQVIGVFDRSLLRTLADVLLRLGVDHVLVVHGDDGSDEITTLGVTHVCELDITPEELGVHCSDERPLAGGSAAENAEIAYRILNGDRTPARDIVVLNAGAAIYVAGIAETLAGGVHRAAESIDSGSARNKLDRLRQFCGEAAG